MMNLGKNSIHFTLILIVVVAISLASGCSIGYYSQSISGHLSLMSSRVDIEDLLNDHNAPSDLKEKLQLVLQIREFASETLQLPKNDSYKSYVELDRKHVVWNVVAAPEFSMELDKWCFLIVGCVNYRGYFSEQDAQSFAEALRAEGKDVYVPGVDAYSTLGWFDDPMLSTLLRRSEPRLAGLVFHELAHQLLYIKNDSAFNESFAKAVEIEGVHRWMQHRGTPKLSQLYAQQKQRNKQFVELVKSTSETLKQLYAQDLPAESMRRKKAEIYQQMQQSYGQLKDSWQGYNGYDRWFAKDLNNAKLGTVGIYRDLVPAFQALLQQHNGDLQAFYDAAKRLSKKPKEERTAELNKLLQSAIVLNTRVKHPGVPLCGIHRNAGGCYYSLNR
jgi:predicted aminopeptidase